MPGPGDGLAHRGGGGAGAGAGAPGGAGTGISGGGTAGSGLCLPGGGTGGTGTGSGTGDAGTHDSGDLPCLVYPADPLRQTLAALCCAGGFGAGGDGCLRHLGCIHIAGIGAGGRSSGAASAPKSDSPPPGTDGGGAGAPGGGGGDAVCYPAAINGSGTAGGGYPGAAGPGGGTRLRYLLGAEQMHPAPEPDSRSYSAPAGGGLSETGQASSRAALCPGAAQRAEGGPSAAAGIPGGGCPTVSVFGGISAFSCGRSAPADAACAAGIRGAGRCLLPGQGARQWGSLYCLPRRGVQVLCVAV